MATLNTLVRHVLTLKYLAGMFDHPITDESRVQTAELTPANLAWARTIAGRSMVLLENRDHALPLSTNVSKVAVVGPLADDASDQLGPDQPIGYDVTQGKVVTVRQGIASVVGAGNVTYAQGCEAACTSDSEFSDAVNAANGADVTVVVVGEPASDSGEASSRSDISLPGQQQALIDAIAKTGKPYVVVLMNGRPLTLGSLSSMAPALLEAWYPGTEGGDAVADVLFGKVDPGGKLPDVVPPQRRSDPDFVQRAADRTARRPEQQVHLEVPRRRQQPAVRVRVRAVIHDVLGLRSAPLERRRLARRLGARQCDGHQHGVGGRR
jgi:beta-glucosidase